MKLENIIEKRYTLMYMVMGLIHLFYLVLFVIYKYPAMAFINGLGMLFFIVFTIMSMDKRNWPSCNLVAMIVFAASVFSHSVAMGEGLCFQHAFIAIIPVFFYFSYENKRKMKRPLIYSGIYFALMILCLIINHFSGEPAVVLGGNVNFVIALVNSTASFAAAMLFLCLFVIKAAENAGVLLKANTNLENSANYDALTGLRNRRSIDTYMDKAFNNARCEGKDFSILMCDIDDFKKVNDTYGHDCGDEILVMVSNIIQSTIRANDTVFRWGGEEILVLVDGNRFCAQKIAERCRSAIEASEVNYKDDTVKVTITIGGASYFQGTNVSELTKKADDNLYKGKKNGKNQVVF